MTNQRPTIPLSLRWSVETSRPCPYAAQAYRGESVVLSASLDEYGAAVDLTGASAALYWHPVGAEDPTAWWEAPAAAAGNVVSATFDAASMDDGHDAYVFFLQAAGAGGKCYRANGVIRMLASPGAVPNEIPFPPRVIDFATVTVSNAPYYTRAELDALLAAKATRDEMTTAIGTRATKTELETLQTDLASKATKAELTEALAEKAGVSALAAHTSDQSNPHQVTAAQIGAMEAPTSSAKRLTGGFFITGTYDSGGGGFCGDNVTFPASRTKAPTVDKLTRNANGSLYWEQGRILTDKSCVIKDALVDASSELQVRNGNLTLKRGDTYEEIATKDYLDSLTGDFDYLCSRNVAPKEYATNRITASNETIIPIAEDGYGAFYLTVPDGLTEFFINPQYSFSYEESFLKWTLLVDCRFITSPTIAILPGNTFWSVSPTEYTDELILKKGKMYFFEMIRFPEFSQDGSLDNYATIGALQSTLW